MVGERRTSNSDPSLFCAPLPPPQHHSLPGLENFLNPRKFSRPRNELKDFLENLLKFFYPPILALVQKGYENDNFWLHFEPIWPNFGTTFGLILVHFGTSFGPNLAPILAHSGTLFGALFGELSVPPF